VFLGFTHGWDNTVEHHSEPVEVVAVRTGLLLLELPLHLFVFDFELLLLADAEGHLFFVENLHDDLTYAPLLLCTQFDGHEGYFVVLV